jgi:hypothetical protein
MKQKGRNGSCMQWTYDHWLSKGKKLTVVCGLHKFNGSINETTHWWLEDDTNVYTQLWFSDSKKFESETMRKVKFYNTVQQRKIKLNPSEMERWIVVMSYIYDNAMHYDHEMGWHVLNNIKLYGSADMVIKQLR